MVQWQCTVCSHDLTSSLECWLESRFHVQHRGRVGLPSAWHLQGGDASAPLGACQVTAMLSPQHPLPVQLPCWMVAMFMKPLNCSSFSRLHVQNAYGLDSRVISLSIRLCSSTVPIKRHQHAFHTGYRPTTWSCLLERVYCRTGCCCLNFVICQIPNCPEN